MQRQICAPLFAALFAITNFAAPAWGQQLAGDESAPAQPRGAQELRIAQNASPSQESRSARERADDHAEDPRHAGHRHDPALDEIVVSAPLPGQRRFDLVRGSTVLSEDDLQRALRTTLGDTLSQQPGVSSSGFVPGAGRPIIRGLDGPRVSVLQNGVGVWDESESSTDHHAVAANPALARRVEVLRGAGTLRYSNSAVGGVVNVVDGRVPDLRPPDAEGALRMSYGSNADLRDVSSRLLFGAGNFAFHVAGGLQRSHDLEVRGAPLSAYAQAEAEDDDPLLAARDVVPNSALRSGEGGFGISRIFESGHLGLSWRRMQSRFGVPLPHEHHEEDDHGMGGMQMGDMHMDDDDHEDEHEEEAARVELDTVQDRFDLAGAWRGALGPFEGMDFHGVYGDFTQDELEDGQVGTTFTRRGAELRVEAQQRSIELADGALEGVLGVHARSERRGTRGEEAFIPSHDSQFWALFAAEEFSLGQINLEGGLRIERSSLRPAQGAQFARRNFSTWSASLGASWTPRPDLLLGISLSRGGRPPGAAELHAEGEHLAAASYEIGDANLKAEEVWNAELTARRRQGLITGSVSLFVTRFDSFIFLGDANCPQRMNVDLPVRCYQQSDADFQGGELELALSQPLPGGALRFELGADYVRGEQQGGVALPRIPPLRLRLGAVLQTQRFDWRLDWLRVASQKRVAAGELPTGDYHVLGGEIAFRPVAGNPGLSFFLRAHNLTNRAGRSHVSLHKERVPIAGRDIRAGMRLQF